jgi:glycosyltransferase involved in cell wall biosynthesis
MRVLFILPGRGGGGGANSVMQESIGLKQYGVESTIATSGRTLESFRSSYPELEDRGVRIVGFDESRDLTDELKRCDVAVATTYQSAYTLRDAMKAAGVNVRTAYYVQDYEPLFCLPGSTEWDRARDSYSLVADQLLFAKTKWLCEIVEANHQRAVRKVLPSIDHHVYFPGRKPDRERISISAMIRPRTPRRAPHRTARILERIADTFGDKVELTAFGSPPDEMSNFGIRLSDRVQQRGHLSRRDVADVLRASDIFLDLSDYQAFGRTGLEGMACGAIPVLPRLGGTDEYARNFVNAMLVDTRDDAAIMRAVSDIILLDGKARKGMTVAAVETSLNYTAEKAAFSEYTAFSELLAA